MSKFTPGPWRIVSATEFGESTIVPSDGDAEEGPFIAEVFGGLDESHANARLVRAAPDLYSALKEVVAISDRKHDAWDKAHAALALARGEDK